MIHRASIQASLCIIFLIAFSPGFASTTGHPERDRALAAVEAKFEQVRDQRGRIRTDELANLLGSPEHSKDVYGQAYNSFLVGNVKEYLIDMPVSHEESQALQRAFELFLFEHGFGMSLPSAGAFSLGVTHWLLDYYSLPFGQERIEFLRAGLDVHYLRGIAIDFLVRNGSPEAEKALEDYRQTVHPHLAERAAAVDTAIAAVRESQRLIAFSPDERATEIRALIEDLLLNTEVKYTEAPWREGDAAHLKLDRQHLRYLMEMLSDLSGDNAVKLLEDLWAPEDYLRRLGISETHAELIIRSTDLRWLAQEALAKKGLATLQDDRWIIR